MRIVRHRTFERDSLGYCPTFFSHVVSDAEIIDKPGDFTRLYPMVVFLRMEFLSHLELILVHIEKTESNMLG